ncbi:xanthine dehydrogenase family protein molybdopterin-binding subunit [Mesorhizobium sp. 1B3]|uniref:xanthine dehydrogenase family protein molybdopterin-binding subunit n=1 Tax=Mesorhizobium sp. 1B3 TaxID=3243599 RepID=UPI003D95AA38
MDRVDALEKVTGKAQYAADYRADGQCIALAVRSSIACGRITSIDTFDALAIPGVITVVTHLNASEFGWDHDPETDALGAEELGRDAMGDRCATGLGYRPLCSPDIVFAGQWVALCVAESIEAARAAAAAVKVDYTTLAPHESDPIRPGFFFGADMQYSRGSPNDAHHYTASLHETYETPVQLHQPMEPSATLAVWHGDDLRIYDSNQGVHAARAYVASSLRLPQRQVRIVSAYVGGGFGQKNQVWPHQALAAHIARRLKRPVRLQLTRRDMAVACGYRSETTQHVTLAADQKGRLGLMRHVSEVPTSLSGGFFEPCGLGTTMLYKADRIEVEHLVRRRAISTPTVLRAPGEAPGSFALETAMDELAFRLRMDPLRLRVENIAERDEYHGREWSSNRLRDCYAIGAARFGWPDHFVEPRSQQRNGKQVGLGVATTAYPAPVLPAGVRLTLDSTAGLTVETAATDIGTGMRTLLARTVGEHLALDPRCVKVVLGDSDLPEAPTAGRSKSTASILPAIKAACEELIGKLDRLAAKAERGNDLAGLVDRLKSAGIERLSAEARSSGAPKQGNYSFYSFGVHFVEVEVDELIGRLSIERVLSVLDCGKIINGRLAESQIKGGVIFGIGMALMENGRRHPKDLSILADNLAEYAIPVHADIPFMDVVFVEHPDTALNDAGARGLGEIGLPGVAAAIGNAVFNATGRRCRSLPISTELLQGGRSS